LPKTFYNELDSNLNLFVDRIYRIDWIFLFPHFLLENEGNRSDFVGRIVGSATVPTYRAAGTVARPTQIIPHLSPQAIEVCRFSSGKPAKIS